MYGFPLYFRAVALSLALFSFASRQSGLYIAFLCAAFMVFLLFKELCKRFSLKPCFIFVGLVLLATFCAAGYLANIKIYGNPIFPFEAPWPFDRGEYMVTVDHYRSFLNILGLPPVILQFYLLFALGIGIEMIDKFLALPSFFPMALERTVSMGWPNPILFVVLIL